MLKWLTNLPIFRRLFLAFFLAALIPDIIIIILSNDYQQALINTAKVTPALTDPLTLATILALLITTGVVVVLGFLVNLTITQRLRHVAALTKRIERGETSRRVRLTGHDEI